MTTVEVDEPVECSSCGFLTPQGPNSCLTTHLPEGKIKQIVINTSLCFWLSMFLVLVVLIISVIIMGIRGLLVAFILPILFLAMRYLWWRLVWEPFGPIQNNNDELQDIVPFLVATGQICCPAKCRYHHVCCVAHSSPYILTTALFWGLFALCFLGLFLSEPVGHQSVDPPVIIVICFNIGGAMVLLIVSVWIVDAIEIIATWTLAALSTIHTSNKSVPSQNLTMSNTRNSHPDQILCRDTNINMDVSDIDRSKLELGFVDEREHEFLKSPASNQEVNNSSENNLGTRYSCILSKTCQRRAKAFMALLIFLIILSFSTTDCYGNPRGVDLSIPVRQLPPCADGFKLALLTDVHAGSLVGSQDMQTIVNELQNWGPDAVAISGDLGDQVVNSALKDKIAPLADLQTTPDGVFWTPGNHENIAGIEGYRDLFFPMADDKSSLGFIKTLENSYHSIAFSRSTALNCTFDIAGLADASGEYSTETGQMAPDINQTLFGRNPNNALVLLNHQPVDFQRYTEAGAGLILAGHTHGGQIWPNHALLWFVYGFRIAGLFTDNSPILGVSNEYISTPSYLYVSEGTVGWGPRVRLLSYPEITYITLRNPDIFFAEGGSTSQDESWRAAVIAELLGLIILPLSIAICALQSFGCCWRNEIEEKAQYAFFKILKVR